MLNFFLKSAEYDIRTVVNMVLFYFRKIPVLNWLAPGSSYKNEKLKRFLIFISPLAMVVMTLIRSLFALAILAAVSTFFWTVSKIFVEISYSQVFLSLALIFYLLDFADFYFIDKKEKALIYFELFKVNPKTIFLANLFINTPIRILGRFLALVLIGLMANFPVKDAFYIAVLSYFTYAIYNYINGRLLEKKILSETSIMVLGFVSLLLMALAYVLMIAFNITYTIILTNFYFKLVLVILGILALVGLSRFKGYGLILSRLGQDYESLNTKTKKKQAIEKANQIKVEDLESSKAHLKKDLAGYKLLNELFFQRHRRHILKPIIIKSIILAIVVLVIVLIPLLPIESLQEELPADYGQILIKSLTGFIPFACYIVFYNEAITRIMFANCDQALMQYGFYTRPKDLLEMFFLRLKKLGFWNALSILPFGIFLVLMKSIHGAALEDVIILGLQYLALWVFFSVHTLFVYYIFQPYNSAQEPKSPVYFIINLAVYYVSWFTMQLGLKGPLIAPIFIGASIVYSVLALVAVYYLAPKTFKVRVGRS
ncbi:MAG: hypothetical protein Q4E36_01350 [Bacillota bacterium]|nr:hypothetical protein [Bacillota bacterium]